MLNNNTLTKTEKDLLEKIYFDLDNPASYGSVNSLYNAAKAKNKNISFKHTKEWLSNQPTYSLHKQSRKHFLRRQTVVSGVNVQYQADLVILDGLRKWNNNNRYLLTFIDAFSRKAQVKTLKKKTGSEVALKLKDIIEHLPKTRQKRYLQVDHGTEFYNFHVKSLLASHNIKLFSVNSEKKAAIIERFNRTLQDILWRYFTKKKTWKYIDVLPKIVSKYNNKIHRTIGMSPNSVNLKNEEKLWYKLYAKQFPPKAKFKYNIGDYVRLSKDRSVFGKSFTGLWTDEIFRIKYRRSTNPVTYRVVDLKQENVLGSFYEYELQKVPNRDLQ